MTHERRFEELLEEFERIGVDPNMDRVPVGGFGWHMDETTDVAVFEWVVAEKGDYEVTVHHERAGRINVTIKV